MIRSRVNQPNRVSLRSDDDITNANNQNFSQFSINLPTAVLGASSCDMIRATIPNSQGINIPDYQLFFWFYTLDSEFQTPTVTQLRCVRLYPSNWQNPDGYTAFVKNRFFTDPTDLVTTLNAAASTDLSGFNPYFANGDIQFTFDATTKKIGFFGNSAGKFYAPAGYDDPNIRTALLANPITFPTYLAVGGNGVTRPQPFVLGYFLNLRLGYSMSGLARGINSFDLSGANLLYANPQNFSESDGDIIFADSFPCLVYTSCIYLYTNIANGGSTTSSNRQNLLAVVPVNSAPLGITNYIPGRKTPFFTLANTIQNITVELRDDADQPLPFADSSSINVELYFTFDK